MIVTRMFVNMYQRREDHGNVCRVKKRFLAYARASLFFRWVLRMYENMLVNWRGTLLR